MKDLLARKVRDVIWSMGLERVKARYEPAADNGFLGPDSVSWKVWSYPTSWVNGFARSVTIEQLDPNLNAAVEKTGGVRYRPRTRYERTMRYFSLQLFGDTATTARAADILVKIHSKAVGIDPVTGHAYDANDPDSQLWIHVTAWHSILYCYEKMGPGPLTPEEEQQYWEECAIIAQLQTIDPEKVPRSRDEVRAYFESWRPRLAASEHAQTMTKFILQAKVALPKDIPEWSRPIIEPIAWLLGQTTITTYPRHIRSLFGLRDLSALDRPLQEAMRVVYALIACNPLIIDAVGNFLIPTTMPIAAPAIYGVTPLSEQTMTPREAQAMYGYAIPSQAHHDFRERQKQRVFQDHEAPSDAGLDESELIIGATGERPSPASERALATG